jgi:5'(3')-deoxyribonucleotidase
MTSMPTPVEYENLSKKVRVLFDVDGVIADYAAAHVNAIVATGVRSIPITWRPTEWDIDEELKLTAAEKAKVSKIMAAPGIAQTFVAMPGAIDAVKRVAKIAEVYFVTTPMLESPTWPYDRAQWLCSQFGDSLGQRVVHTHYKYLVPAHHLVDDKVDNCHKWEAANPSGVALRYRTSRMDFAKDIINVSDWHAVERFIQITVQRYQERFL